MCIQTFVSRFCIGFSLILMQPLLSFLSLEVKCQELTKGWGTSLHGTLVVLFFIELLVRLFSKTATRNNRRNGLEHKHLLRLPVV